MNMRDVFFTIIFVYVCTRKEVLTQSSHLDSHWQLFKDLHNKTYHPMLELRKRRVWEDNLHRINKHNAEATIGHHRYTLRANHLADMTARQYVRQMVKLTKSRRRRIGDNLVGGINFQQLDIPEELDWRKKGFVTRSLNQLDCGSCYAFSIVTAIEGQLFKQSGQYTELRSIQVLNPH